MERLTSAQPANSQSAECTPGAYYQTFKKSPRFWTCTATFSACSSGASTLPVQMVWARGCL